MTWFFYENYGVWEVLEYTEGVFVAKWAREDRIIKDKSFIFIKLLNKLID